MDDDPNLLSRVRWQPPSMSTRHDTVSLSFQPYCTSITPRSLGTWNAGTCWLEGASGHGCIVELFNKHLFTLVV
ncbi:hypothetical protein Hanom_Chr03g00202171 [Helianthus anomalus]